MSDDEPLAEESDGRTRRDGRCVLALGVLARVARERTAPPPMSWTNKNGHNNYGRDHKRWATAVLMLHPVCQWANPTRCTKPSTDADHIIPIARGGARYDLNNGQGLCREHHRFKTASIDSKPIAKRTRPAEPHPGIVR